MKEPPPTPAATRPLGELSPPKRSEVPPSWRRGHGVSEGVWDYVHRQHIAEAYDDFLRGTPLCELDQRWVLATLQRTLGRSTDARIPPSSSDQTNVRVADFGCGNGRLAVPLLRSGYDVLGLDLSRPMLRNCRQKAVRSLRETSHTRPGKLTLLRCNLVDLRGLGDDVVEAGICMFATLGMIQGRANRRTFLSHARRMIRPGGPLLLHVHHRWSALGRPGGLAELCRSAWSRDDELGDAVYAYRGIGKMFMHGFGRRELQSDLRATGWSKHRMVRIDRTGTRIVHRWSLAGGFFVEAC